MFHKQFMRNKHNNHEYMQLFIKAEVMRFCEVHLNNARCAYKYNERSENLFHRINCLSI